MSASNHILPEECEEIMKIYSQSKMMVKRLNRPSGQFIHCPAGPLRQQSAC